MSILGASRHAGSSAGDLFSNVSRTVGLRSAQPWLPPGPTLGARVFRHGLELPVWVPWLDNGGVDEALLRLTCATSLTGAPVVTSLALRVAQADDSIGDLVFRRPLRSHHSSRRPAMMTSGPYLVDSGVISLGARECGAETFELFCLADDGDWVGFADVRVGALPVDGTVLQIDPASNPLPGLEMSIRVPRAS